MPRKITLRKVSLISLIVLLSTGQAGIVSAGINVWTSIGPEGGCIRALAIDPVTPTILYAGTWRGGVFKSTNSGGSWSLVSTGLPASYVYALAIDPVTPTTLYAGTDDGVFKSMNGGESWSTVNSGLPTYSHIRALAIDPVTPTTLYAGTNDGIFKSTNGGGNWSPVNTGLIDTDVYALAIDPVTPTTLYAGTYDGGVFKSTDSGDNWGEVNTGLTTSSARTLAIDPVTPTTLYAGTKDGVFKSTNGGGNWSPVNTGLTNISVLTLAIDPAIPTTLYAGTYDDGVFKSTDGGGNWSAVNTGLTRTYVPALSIDPVTPATLYTGTSDGVFKSINGGGDWSPVNTGLTNTFIATLVIDPATPITLYAGTSRGVFKSTNGGGGWSPVNTGLTTSSARTLAIDPVTPTTLYVGTSRGVFKSTNGGGNWSAVNTGLTDTDVLALAIDPVTPTILYAGTVRYVEENDYILEIGCVFKSTNGGENWSAVNTGLNAPAVYALAIDPMMPTTLYAGTHSSGVFKSTNGGGNWSPVNTDLPAYPNVRTLAIDPVTPTILYAGTWRGGVFKSTNSGGSWSLVSTGLPASYVYALAIDPVTPTTLYAGTDDGVFKSMNGGESWIVFNTGLTVYTYVKALAIDPVTSTTLYAATDGNGVFAIQMVTVPENVTLSGPTSGMPYSTHTFTASVGPITTTTPITYVWEATGQLPMTTTADLTGTATFNWSAGGEQVITVTAANAAGMVSDTHGINIEHVPPREIIISGPTTGVVNTVYTFTATVGPGTVTMPITYTWTPAPNSGQGTAVVDFTWAITGDKTITVTAENISGTASYAVSDTHVIAIREPYHIYLPLTLRHWSPPPDPDQYEPNDTMDTAFVLPVATSVTATDLNFVPSYVDQDWFAFYVKTGQLYQASTSNLVGVDTYLAVYDVAGDQVTADDNGGGGFASKTEWQATHVGYYYIEVTNLTASSTPWNTYDLSVEEAVPIAPTSTLTSALTIAQVEWNPPGPDLEGEYVMITNRGEDIQDMTGWTLSDADYHTYSFPTSFFLCSKCSVRVWTKSGTDVVTNLYWGRSSAVWDNTGDCAYLRDGAGTLVDSYCY